MCNAFYEFKIKLFYSAIDIYSGAQSHPTPLNNTQRRLNTLLENFSIWSLAPQKELNQLPASIIALGPLSSRSIRHINEPDRRQDRNSPVGPIYSILISHRDPCQSRTGIGIGNGNTRDQYQLEIKPHFHYGVINLPADL